MRRTKGYYKKAYRDLKFNVEKPILDIGGNDGAFLEHFGIQNATILDLTQNKNPKFNYITADITKKLLKIDTLFKTIFIMETLEHLRNPLYLMAQVYDLLDEGGKCYISIPYTKLETREHIFENFDEGHVSRWTKKEIVEQMNKLGFNVQVIQQIRRFRNTAFWLPHAWLVLKLTKEK